MVFVPVQEISDIVRTWPEVFVYIFLNLHTSEYALVKKTGDRLKYIIVN